MTNAKSLTTATSEASTSVQAEFASMTNTIAETEKDYQENNEEIVQKMKADKAKALEEINVAGQDAAKATANLRSDAEAFTLKAKDQWKNHYQRTEIALREKSDKSSAHVSALQEKTGEKDFFTITDLGSLIGKTQGGNFTIFLLPLRFYLKAFIVN